MKCFSNFPTYSFRHITLYRYLNENRSWSFFQSSSQNDIPAPPNQHVELFLMAKGHCGDVSLHFRHFDATRPPQRKHCLSVPEKITGHIKWLLF